MSGINPFIPKNIAQNIQWDKQDKYLVINGQKYEVIVRKGTETYQVGKNLHKDVLDVVQDAFSKIDDQINDAQQVTILRGKVRIPSKETQTENTQTISRIFQGVFGTEEGVLPAGVAPVSAQTLHTGEKKELAITTTLSADEIELRLVTGEEPYKVAPYQAPAKAQKGAEIKDEFATEKGMAIGTDQALRQNTVQAFREFHENQFHYVEEQLQRTGLDEKEKESLQRELAFLKARFDSLSDAITNERTCALSNSYRKMIDGKNPDEKAQVDASYLPVAVNMRRQEFRSVKGELKASYVRSGALTDPRHGETNLEQLGKILGKTREGKALSPPEFIALNRVLGESGAKVFRSASQEEKIKIVEALYDDRKFYLQSLFLQDVQTHLAGEIPKGPVARFGRVGLLGYEKKEQNLKGQIASEPNQFIDQIALYKLFDGKKIIFDGKGPFIDREGNIHMGGKAQLENGEPVEKKIETFLFNVDIGHKLDNLGRQQEQNREMFHKLRDALPSTTAKKLMELEKKLEQYKPYEYTPKMAVAEEIVALLAEHGIYMSFNCFAGKDRTGMVASSLTFRQLEKASTESILDHNERVAFLYQAGQHLAFDDSSVSNQVLQDNTGLNVFKINAFKTPLRFLHQGDKGIPARMARLGYDLKMTHRGALAQTIARPKKEAVGEGVIGY